MKVAIEVNALSQSYLTGVGSVVQNYIKQFQKLDKQNEYFLYSQDKILNIEIFNPNWEIVEFDYLIKRHRQKISNLWKVNKKKLYCKIFIRIYKIYLELIDELFFSIKLAKSIKKHNISIYIATSTYFFPYFFLRPIIKVGILYDLVWKFFPDTMEIGNKIKMKLFSQKNLKKLDMIVSISESTKNDAINLFKLKNKIYSIPLAADSKIYYKANKNQINEIKKKHGILKKYIISVCTVEPRKNLISLLNAFSIIPQKNDYQIVLVGMQGWKSEAFYVMLDKLNISQNIILTGYVSDSDLAALYSGAEVFVCPSLYEGFGLPILEAMQCGCPVIASNRSSMPEVAGNAAILVNPNDINDISHAINNIMQNRNLKERLKLLGCERAKLFSWEKSAKLFLNYLNLI
jgi:glycosyltransferase involved in cell wall biosynthesis